MKKPILRLVVTFSVLLSAFVAHAQKPSIATFLPRSGAAGTSVIITGTGFNAVAANNIVRFGAVKATVTLATAVSLTVTVPAGANYQPINVLNTANGLSGNTACPFTTTFTGCSPLNSSSLSAKVDFTANATTRSVAFGDLDGDGKGDMVATNTGAANMSVYRNISTGGAVSFAAKADFTTGVPGSAASGLAIGDINGDGKLDIAVSNYNTASVSVFINTTTGTTISFAAKTDLTTMTNPLGVVISDIDGDGKPDIAVANYGAAGTDHPSVSLFRNTSTTGTISFASQTLTAGLTAPRELAVGDMDADGKPDLVVSDEGGAKMLAYHSTSVSGTISFSAPVIADAAAGARGLSLGDLDGDGKLDIAVANNTSNSVSVFRNACVVSGTIALATRLDYACGTGPRELALADIDGDGRPEMAASGNTSSCVSVYRNTSVSGTISFAGKTDFTTLAGSLGVNFEDVNNDGKIDLAVVSNTGSVAILANASPLSTLANVVSATIVAGGICDNSTWKTFYDGSSNGVTVSIKDNGNDLGTIATSVYVESQPGALVGGWRYMARHFVIKPSVQPVTPVQVRLYFTDAELLALKAVDPAILSAGDLSVTKYNGPNEDGVYNTAGGTATIIPSTSITNGTAYNARYLEFTVSSFSEFWIHSGFTVLPVNLTGFTADKKAGSVLLKWTTASEQNADRFIVERSADGRSYSALGSIAASGYSTQSQTYSYTDEAPLNGNNYYRLQQVDGDGKRNESKVLTVNYASGNRATVTLAYQSSKQIRVAINGKVSNGAFIIYDGNGRQIKSYRVNGPDGSVLNLDLNAYGAGLYLYQLVTDQGNLSTGKMLLN